MAVNIITDERFGDLLRGLTLCLMCVLSLCFHALAQESNFQNIPIAWFEEPEQHAPHWRVHFDPPTLTYSQRLIVSVRAIVPTNGKQRSDWHILLRIADESGRWFQDYDSFRVDLRGLPPKAGPVLWHGYAFVQPGTYRLALVAYDAINQRHFVWHKMMRVDRPSVLPDLDRNLPKVEFVDSSQIPPPPIPEYLPVHTQAPVQIDVIFNLTGNQQLSLTPSGLDSFRQPYVENELRGSTALLSQLAPSQGCVRVSAIDILRLKVMLDRSSADPASNLNRIQQAIPSALDNSAVDVHTLVGRTKAREFFHQFLETVIRDKAACNPQEPNAGRAIIVVSDSLVFPAGADREPLSAPEHSNALFFHVRFAYTVFIRQDPPFLTAVTTLDEVGHMLGPLHPRNFSVAGPDGLRRAVAEIVKDIEASVTVSAAQQ